MFFHNFPENFSHFLHFWLKKKVFNYSYIGLTGCTKSSEIWFSRNFCKPGQTATRRWEYKEVAFAKKIVANLKRMQKASEKILTNFKCMIVWMSKWDKNCPIRISQKDWKDLFWREYMYFSKFYWSRQQKIPQKTTATKPWQQMTGYKKKVYMKGILVDRGSLQPEEHRPTVLILVSILSYVQPIKEFSPNEKEQVGKARWCDIITPETINPSGPLTHSLADNECHLVAFERDKVALDIGNVDKVLRRRSAAASLALSSLRLQI